jgi:beta-glucosidase
MAALGVDAYRFSMAWTRVQPDGRGAWNERGFDFYKRLMDTLQERGIAPHLTLYHWDLPQGLQDTGGWMARDTAHRFADYAHEVARRFGDRLVTIATHNEPWCTANLGYGNAQFAPGVADPKQAVQVSHHLLLSHGLAMQAMRAAEPKAKLGIVLNQWTADPATDSEADRALAKLEWARSVQWFMDPIFKRRYPELALAHHGANAPQVRRRRLRHHRPAARLPGRELLPARGDERGRPAAQAGRRRRLHRHGLGDLRAGPDRAAAAAEGRVRTAAVYITENGMAADDRLEDGAVRDTVRVEYVRTHLEALKAAMDQGVDVRGYFLWSLLDNFEWNSGYAKRFGIVHVDYATQARTPKASALWYRDFIAGQRRARRHAAA